MTSGTDDDDDRLDSLGIPAGERRLVSPRTGRHRIEFILRVLAIVRSAQDLRAVGELESSRRTVPWQVWQAPPVTDDLGCEPIHDAGGAIAVLPRRPGAATVYPGANPALHHQPRPRIWQGPFTVLRARPRARRSSRRQLRSLFFFADLVRLSDLDWCSKCGGYAVRRLLDAQLDYYRSAHRLLNIHDHIVRCERDSGFSRLSSQSVEQIVDELDDLKSKFPNKTTNPFSTDSNRWRTAVLDLRGRAVKMLDNLG